MIPAWWPSVVLALGVYRLVRLIGWDDFPLAVRVRAWVAGERQSGSVNAQMRLTNEHLLVSYRRPVLAHFLGCPFCQGWWVSLAAYAAWRWDPTATLTVLAPFALSGAVGLIAKNLDP